MGTDFDFMDERSHHGAKGISGEATGNRRLLRAIMESSGFEPYDREWWHYALKNEPYPDSYFDFPILVGSWADLIATPHAETMLTKQSEY
jgi:D-alanyl-D-alanine dipeptidase